MEKDGIGAGEISINIKNIIINMVNLGFTFYPKDWWTSDSFFILSAFERYVYLELLFMMYSNGGFVLDNKVLVEGRLRTTIKEEVWRKITDLLVKEGDKLTHKSVNSRLKKTLANRENGKLGGRPKRDVPKPNKPKQETQNNPPLENEVEIESEIEIKDNTPTSYLDNNNEDRIKSFNFSQLGKQPIEKLKKNLAGAQTWFDQVGMKNSILPQEVGLWFEKFCTHCLAQGKDQMTEKDFKSYFANWVTKMKTHGLGLEVKSEIPRSARDIASEVIMDNYERGTYDN